jgi:hypothetical protein
VTSSGPRTAEARARRDRGFSPVDRPLPAYLECAVGFTAPRRLLRDTRLTPSARLVGLGVCAWCRDRTVMATDLDNAALGRLLGLSRRVVQRGLIELEERGYLYRLDGRNRLDLDSLHLVGYRDPWGHPGHARPTRALVLLWRLPRPARLGGKGGVGRGTPGGVRHGTPSGRKGGGR